jgi:hypothetical protein
MENETMRAAEFLLHLEMKHKNAVGKLIGFFFSGN